MNVTHVLFDFFGTLVEYSPSVTEQGYEGSYALLRRAGYGETFERFLEQWSVVFHRFERRAATTLREFSMLELVGEFLGEALGASEALLVARFAETYLAEWNRGVVYDGATAAWLRRLSADYRLGIISNTNDPRLVPEHLERMGVGELFGGVVTSIGCGTRKPSREIFEYALRKFGAEAGECLYVGDSYQADYRGAEAAGLRSYLLDPSGAAPIPAARRLRKIAEIEPLLGRMR
jgi:putative hydrolase of the HAD superfamily